MPCHAADGAANYVAKYDDAKSVGFPVADSYKGLYNLTFLNHALKAAGEPTIAAAKT